MRLAGHLVLLPAILFSVFAFSESTSQDQSLIADLNQMRVKVARLESVLEESIQNINSNSLNLKEQEKLIEEMENKIHHLQYVLSSIKGDSLHSSERLTTLQEEMADIVTEQWIQIQQLEQALLITEKKTIKIYKEVRASKCTFYKFVNDLSGKRIMDASSMSDLLFGRGSTLSSYMSQSLQHFRRLFSAVQKYHHGLQGFIRREMEKNEFTAALSNKEVVFFMAFALITFPILGAWILLSPQFS